MTLEVQSPLAPMEARSVEQTFEGGEWRYEPKWNGFRCLAFRNGERVELQSKSRGTRQGRLGAGLAN